LLDVQSIFLGYGYACALDSKGAASCWGDKTGTPSIAPEAIPFSNQISTTPSGPILFLSGYGSGGFNSQLIYITSSGVLVNGYNVVNQMCP
ncbi:MAG TPA: hypothetical protein VGI39_06210, partial [Polyangiaceae bacterium]